jgi:hypothetical protein
VGVTWAKARFRSWKFLRFLNPLLLKILICNLHSFLCLAVSAHRPLDPAAAVAVRGEGAGGGGGANFSHPKMLLWPWVCVGLSRAPFCAVESFSLTPPFSIFFNDPPACPPVPLALGVSWVLQYRQYSIGLVQLSFSVARGRCALCPPLVVSWNPPSVASIV